MLFPIVCTRRLPSLGPIGDFPVSPWWYDIWLMKSHANNKSNGSSTNNYHHHSNGFIPNSLKFLSSCIKTASSGVRSASASVAASISGDNHENKDQVGLWLITGFFFNYFSLLKFCDCCGLNSRTFLKVGGILEFMRFASLPVNLRKQREEV